MIPSTKSHNLIHFASRHESRLPLLLVATLIPSSQTLAGNPDHAAEQLKKFPTDQTGYLVEEASLKSLDAPRRLRTQQEMERLEPPQHNR